MSLFGALKSVWDFTPLSRSVVWFDERSVEYIPPQVVAVRILFPTIRDSSPETPVLQLGGELNGEIEFRLLILKGGGIEHGSSKILPLG